MLFAFLYAFEYEINQMTQKLIIGIFTLVAMVAQAQTMQFMSTRTDSNAKTSNKVTAIKDIHLLPLFGETNKSLEQIEKEISFLSDCDRDFENRTEASHFFASRGWEYLQENELDTACYRFNLAWLLDNKNADCYWGLGVVCYQKGYLTDAERLLRKGIDIDSTNVGLLVDLATVDMLSFKENKDNWELLEAGQLLDKAFKLDSTNANLYLKKSLIEYHKGNYDLSWANVHKLRAIDEALLDLDFIKDLLDCKPDPKGLFVKY
jgi:tetratricopeptide (TPR) repeat protein